MKLKGICLAGLLLASSAPAQDEIDWKTPRRQAIAEWRNGQLAEAERLLAESYRLAQQGAARPDVIGVARDLAELYCAQGRYQPAEALLTVVVALRELELGEESAEVAVDLDNLGRLALAQMHLGDAEKWFGLSLERIERRVGPDHMDLLPALNSLARLYQTSPRRENDTEATLRRILDIREKNQGPEHPEVASEWARIGRFYFGQKKVTLAEASYVKAVEIVEGKLGPQHVQLVGVLDSLGSLFESDKRFSAAELVYRRAIAIRERTTGPITAEIAPALDSLGRVLFAQKRFADAELVYARALGIWELMVGSDSALFANALDNLAVAKASLAKYAEAEGLYLRALEIREKLAVSSLNNFALVESAQEKFAEAEPAYKVALAILERAGQEKAERKDANRESLLYTTLENYADLLRDTQRKVAARRVEQRMKGLKREEAVASVEARE